MIKSVHCSRCRRLMSINVPVVTSHRFQPPTAQRALSMGAALGLPLPRPTRCLTPALAPARLMSATSSQFIAHGITADATSQSEFDRYLAAPAAEACDAMQWWEANAHHYRNTARLFRGHSNDFRLRVGLLVSCTHDLIQIVLTQSFFFIRTCI